MLEHREADIAIRYVRPIQGQSLVRKIGELGSAAYAHKSLLLPRKDWCKDLPWIGFAQVADRWPEFRWIEANVPTEHVAMTVNGGTAYTKLVARGYRRGNSDLRRGRCAAGSGAPQRPRAADRAKSGSGAAGTAAQRHGSQGIRLDRDSHEGRSGGLVRLFPF